MEGRIQECIFNLKGLSSIAAHLGSPIADSHMYLYVFFTDHMISLVLVQETYKVE